MISAMRFKMHDKFKGLYSIAKAEGLFERDAKFEKKIKGNLPKISGRFPFRSMIMRPFL